MHPALILRRAGVSDIPALSALEKDLFGDCSYPHSVLRQMIDTWSSGLQVADLDETIIGYSLVLESDEPLTCWMWSMGVHADFRRQGVGRLLLTQALERAQSAGLKRLLLTVDPANDVAVKLYLAFDFRVMNDVDDYFGPNERRFVMERIL